MATVRPKVATGQPKVAFGQLEVAVLPSRSALSDLGLISDLFQKMLLNWSSFCLKSQLFGQKGPKSLIFTVSAFHITQKNYLKISLSKEYFQIKVDLFNVGIMF